MGLSGSELIFDKDEKNLFYNNNGTINKYDIATNAPKPISSNGEMNWNAPAERAYMFEHAWRQAREKFYVADLHGVDWELYKKEYLPKEPLCKLLSKKKAFSLSFIASNIKNGSSFQSNDFQVKYGINFEGAFVFAQVAVTYQIFEFAFLADLPGGNLSFSNISGRAGVILDI